MPWTRAGHTSCVMPPIAHDLHSKVVDGLFGLELLQPANIPPFVYMAICQSLRGIFSFGLVVAAPREAWMGREGLECLHQRVRYASGKMSSL
jgi:hypothetical protein